MISICIEGLSQRQLLRCRPLAVYGNLGVAAHGDRSKSRFFDIQDTVSETSDNRSDQW